MVRQLYLWIACLSCFASMACPLLADQRPNVILIMTDDQGFPTIGAHGHPWLQTPSLDQLYRQSTRINPFLVSPTCSPTRSAILTGRNPMRNGITHTILERERLRLDVTTLPEVLQGNGYQTAMIGKWHLGDEPPYQPNRRGFDYSLIHGAGGIGQKYDCSCADVPNNDYFDPILREDGVFVQTSGFCTDVFFEGAMRFIEKAQAKESPIFLYLATNAPHAPFKATKGSKQRFLDAGFDEKSAGFFGMIENFDANMGKLLAALDRWKLRDNTIVIFLSDNGMSETSVPIDGSFAEGFPHFNAGMRGIKNTVDEGGSRVPFWVRWPGHIEANRDLPLVAAHIDIMPTLLELTAAKNNVSGERDGRSFAPHLLGEAASWPDRYLITHLGRWPLGADPDKYQWCRFAIRNQRLRLVCRQMEPQEKESMKLELFDMELDPGQKSDVLAQHPEMVREMLDDYDRWWIATRPHLINEQVPQATERPYWVEFAAQQKSQGIPTWPR